MSHLKIVERRREERAAADIVVLVWGVDTRGERFAQHARAREISRSGALLMGLNGDLHSGDIIGVLYGEKKARFRVVWVRCESAEEKLQAAVHRVEGDPCPWEQLLPEVQPSAVET